MKQFIPFALIVVFLFSCNTPAEKTPSADTATVTDKTPPAQQQSEENLALVNKYFAAIENLDTAERQPHR